MLLGLAMHEPHTCLLREEVVFDPAKRRAIEKLARLEHAKLSDVVPHVNGVNGGHDGEVAATGTNLPPLSAAVQSYSEFIKILMHQ